MMGSSWVVFLLSMRVNKMKTSQMQKELRLYRVQLQAKKKSSTGLEA